jgi:hypothetical protein
MIKRRRRRQTERQQQQQSQRRRRKKGGDAHLSVLCNKKKCPATTNNIRNDGYFRSTLVIKSQHVILHISALLSNADQTQAGWGKWKRQRFHSGEAAGGSPSSLFSLSHFAAAAAAARAAALQVATRSCSSSSCSCSSSLELRRAASQERN